MADAFTVGISLLGQNAFSGVAKQVGSDLDKLGKQSQSFGRQFISLGRTVTAVGVATAAAIGTTAVAAVGLLGKTVLDAGHQFDVAYDSIAVATGATGEALQNLSRDFDAVARAVPVADLVGGAEVLAAFSVRTGLTGEALQGLTAQMMEASRLMGGDAVASTELFTRALGDWGVQSEDASRTMDMFFAASQQTGVGLDSLMAQVVQFGAPLRLMGFSLVESTALFGKWEKEGVNAELAMGSLRIAAGKFAEQGKPLRDSLLATFASIRDNTDATAALAEGMDVFGARAGPDMVAAIREGRFAIDDLVAGLGASEGQILDTAAATMDWGEQMQIFRQRVQVSLAPIGLQLMEVANTLLARFLPVLEDHIVPFIEDRVVPAVEGIATSLGMLMEGDIQGALANLVGEETTAQFVEVAAAVQGLAQQVITFVEEHSEAFKGALIGIGVVLAAAAIAATIAGIVGAIAALASPIGLLIAASALLGAAWAADWGGIRTTLTAFWQETAQPFIDQLVVWFQETVPQALASVRDWFVTAWGNIQATVQRVWTALTAIWAAVVAVFTVTIPGAAQSMRDRITGTIAAIAQMFTDYWNGIVDFLRMVWDIIRLVALAGVILLLELVGTNLDEISASWRSTWSGISDFLSATWGAIRSVVGSVFQAVVEFVGDRLAFLSSSWSTSWAIIREAAAIVWATISTIVSTAVEAVRSFVVGGITALSESWGVIWNGVQTQVEAVWASILVAVGSVLTALVAAVVDRTESIRKGLLEPITAARDAISGMVESWAAVGRSLLDGLIGGFTERVGRLIESVRNAISSAVAEARERLRIGSPSQVFEDIGKSLVQGMVEGISAGRRDLHHSIRDLVSAGGWGRQNYSLSLSSPAMGRGQVVNNTSYRYEYHLQNTFARYDDPIRIEHILSAIEAAHG